MTNMITFDEIRANALINYKKVDKCIYDLPNVNKSKSINFEKVIVVSGLFIAINIVLFALVW
jgi:hypothetical protein